FPPPHPPTTQLHPLSLHDSLPISPKARQIAGRVGIDLKRTASHHQRPQQRPVTCLINPCQDHREAEYIVPLEISRLEPNNKQFRDRKSTRLNSSHRTISYAVFCLK